MGQLDFYPVLFVDCARHVIELTRAIEPDVPEHYLVAYDDLRRGGHMQPLTELLGFSAPELLQKVAMDSSGATLRTQPLRVAELPPRLYAEYQRRNPTRIWFGPDRPPVWRGMDQRFHEREFRLALASTIDRIKASRDLIVERPEGTWYFNPEQGRTIGERDAWALATRGLLASEDIDGIGVAGIVSPMQAAVLGMLPWRDGIRRVHLFSLVGRRYLPLLVYMAEYVYDHLSSDSTGPMLHRSFRHKQYWPFEGRYAGKRTIELRRGHFDSKDRPTCLCGYCRVTRGDMSRLTHLLPEERRRVRSALRETVFELASRNDEGDLGAERPLKHLLLLHNTAVVRRDIAMLSGRVKDRDSFLRFLNRRRLGMTVRAIQLVERLLDASPAGFETVVRSHAPELASN